MSGQQPPLTVEAALAVLLDRTETQGKQLENMATTMASIHAAYVPRTEWEQRNRTVDERHQNLGREIAAEREERRRADDSGRAELKAEVTSRRHPWPTVLGAIAAAVALAISVLNRMALAG